MRPPVISRLRHAVRSGRPRCADRLYAPFLRRRVRCKKSLDHDGQHQYTTFDETVMWS